jgi:hypothetical protein
MSKSGPRAVFSCRNQGTARSDELPFRRKPKCSRIRRESTGASPRWGCPRHRRTSWRAPMPRPTAHAAASCAPPPLWGGAICSSGEHLAALTKGVPVIALPDYGGRLGHFGTFSPEFSGGFCSAHALSQSIRGCGAASSAALTWLEPNSRIYRISARLACQSPAVSVMVISLTRSFRQHRGVIGSVSAGGNKWIAVRWQAYPSYCMRGSAAQPPGKPRL